MAAQADNVGFLATESGVEQFQPWLGGFSVLKGALHSTGQTLPYGMNGGGGENVGMARRLIATMLEKVDTEEAIGLLPVPPPRHSTITRNESLSK
jgi:hypothetical protein